MSYDAANAETDAGPALHEYLVRLLRTTDGNVAQAARMAQRNRTEFYKLLQRHGLTPALFKAEKA